MKNVAKNCDLIHSIYLFIKVLLFLPISIYTFSMLAYIYSIELFSVFDLWEHNHTRGAWIRSQDLQTCVLYASVFPSSLPPHSNFRQQNIFLFSVSQYCCYERRVCVCMLIYGVIGRCSRMNRSMI